MSAHAGPSQFGVSVSQFPIGFFVPNASSNSAPFSGPYYVAVAPYGDVNDDNLAFTQLAGSISYFDPSSNSTGTYNSSSDGNTTLAFGNLPFATTSFGSGSPLPDGTNPGTWGGEDLGVALQFFMPQDDPGCFATQSGCVADAGAAYLTSPPAVYTTSDPDVFDILMSIPSGVLTFQFTLLGLDPSSVGFAYSNDTTANNNTVVILAGDILNGASNVQIVWDSVSFVPGEALGGSDFTAPGTQVTTNANVPGFIQSSDYPDDSVPEPGTLLLFGSGLLLAARKIRGPRA